MKITSARWRHEHRRALRKTVAPGSALAASPASSAAAPSPRRRPVVRPGQGRHQQRQGRAARRPASASPRSAPACWSATAASAVVLDQPGRPLPRRADLARVHRLPDHHRPHDRTRSSSRSAPASALTRPSATARWPPTARCGRRTGGRCGSRRRTDLVRFPVATTAPCPRRRHHRAEPPRPTTSPPGHHRQARPALGHGAVAGRHEALRRAQRRQHSSAIIDTATNKSPRVIPVGNAPRQVVLVGNRRLRLQRGRTPGQARRLHQPVRRHRRSCRTSTHRRRHDRHRVGRSTWSASSETTQIKVGLQPTAEYLGADGTLLSSPTPTTTRSRSSTPATGRVTQTVNVNPLPGSTVGSYPNAITMPDATPSS